MGTFIFFLIWYAFFIVAFGLAFYIMLHKDVKSKEAAANETKADEKVGIQSDKATDIRRLIDFHCITLFLIHGWSE